MMMMELIPFTARRELIPFFGREIDDLLKWFGDDETKESGERSWMPALDIEETKDAIVVSAEVPGTEPKDIDISLSDDILTIKGEKKQENEKKEGRYYRMERSYGSFSRSIRIPKNIKSEEIDAKYKNGTLKVTIPKKEEEKPKEIKVAVE